MQIHVYLRLRNFIRLAHKISIKIGRERGKAMTEEQVQIPGEVTQLLDQWQKGDKEAFQQVIEKVYVDLRKLARQFIRGQGSRFTMDATGLVHELYAKMVGQEKLAFENRGHFLWFASHLMRQIVVDYVRANSAVKRGGRFNQVDLEDLSQIPGRADMDAAMLLSLDKALKKLAVFDSRQSQVVTMHFFAGLTLEEIGEVLNLSLSTIRRDWRIAKKWLATELMREPS